MLWSCNLSKWKYILFYSPCWWWRWKKKEIIKQKTIKKKCTKYIEIVLAKQQQSVVSVVCFISFGSFVGYYDHYQQKLFFNVVLCSTTAAFYQLKFALFRFAGFDFTIDCKGKYCTDRNLIHRIFPLSRNLNNVRTIPRFCGIWTQAFLE